VERYHFVPDVQTIEKNLEELAAAERLSFDELRRNSQSDLWFSIAMGQLPGSKSVISSFFSATS
jgi:hypothetical protein